MNTYLKNLFVFLLAIMFIVGCSEKADYQTTIEARESELAALKDAQEVKVERGALSDDNRATARAVGTELQPEFDDVKSVVKETAEETQASVGSGTHKVGKKVDALTKAFAALEKKLDDQQPVPRVIQPKKVVNEPVTHVISQSPAPSQANTQALKNTQIVNVQASGTMKLVVTGASGDGALWGDMTNWLDGQKVIQNGVGTFTFHDGYDQAMNGKIGYTYLDKVVSGNIGTVKLVDSKGLEYVFKVTDIRVNEKGFPNLYWSYINGQFL